MNWWEIPKVDTVGLRGPVGSHSPAAYWELAWGNRKEPEFSGLKDVGEMTSRDSYRQECHPSLSSSSLLPNSQPLSYPEESVGLLPHPQDQMPGECGIPLP